MPSIEVYNLALSYAKRMARKRNPDLAEKDIIPIARKMVGGSLLALANHNLRPDRAEFARRAAKIGAAKRQMASL